MERADLLQRVAVTLAALIKAGGLNVADTAEGLAFPLDSALRRLGAPTAGPVPGGLEQAGETLAEYYTLLRVRAALATRTDVEAQNARSGKSQVFNQVTMLLEDAANRAAAAGYDPNGAAGDGAPTGAGAFRLGLDFLEPDGAFAGGGAL